MVPFFQISLRTLDVPSAMAFYSGVLGPDVRLNIVQLHEQAIARGARPHWLGFLDVGDVDRFAALFAQRGATALAPKWINPEGLEAAVMRDPGGAIVALAKPPPQSAHAKSGSASVIWHLLNTSEVERAKANYGELFNWAFHEPSDLGVLGTLHPFAWKPGGPAVGAMIDIHGRPGVHPHWLFHLKVRSLENAVSAVRSTGGTVHLLTLPTGENIAICEDPQGAAFALRK